MDVRALTRTHCLGLLYKVTLGPEQQSSGKAFALLAADPSPEAISVFAARFQQL